jgi:SsrA-binding protein
MGFGIRNNALKEHVGKRYLEKSIKIVSTNRKAFHDYHILDKYEAGLVLQGSEVKSLRNGSCQLKDSYVDFIKGEMYLVHVHISVYKPSSYNNHEPERKRKLLMNRIEIDKLESKIREKGLTLIPLKVYFAKGRAKVEIALAKGKQAYDKRKTIKQRDVNRELNEKLRRGR